MTGPELAEIRGALVSAFNLETFPRLVRDNLDIDVRREIIDQGPLTKIVEATLDYLDQQNFLPLLLSAAARDRPGRPELKDLFRRHGEPHFAAVVKALTAAGQGKRLARFALLPDLAVHGDTAIEPAQVLGQLEQCVRPKVPMFDPLPWLDRMQTMLRRVCRIAIGAKTGTGFLVGPEVILTNHHVVRDLIDAKASGTRLVCWFEHWRTARYIPNDGTAVTARAAFDAWHVASSREPDYALVRLARPLGSLTFEAAKEPRGWIYLPEGEPALEAGMPLAIVQHPNGDRLKVALDTEGVAAVDDARTSVEYVTNTEAGSSGSPCFDMSWNLVALHRKKEGTDRNAGIPIGTIRKAMPPTALALLGGREER